MNQVSDMKMAVDATFSSILNEIQLSNLNFTIQMTPYAAYITLKKSSLKYQNGTYAVPSPPILSLLQEAQHIIATQKTEILELQTSYAVSRTKVDNIEIENASLLDKLNESNKALEASENVNDSLSVEIEKVGKELIKVKAVSELLETKVKDSKKKHSNEVTHLNSEIKSIEKLSKSKDKEIYNQKRVVESTRDTLKNLKAKLSNANICRTRLESENRKLKKQLEKKKSACLF